MSKKSSTKYITEKAVKAAFARVLRNPEHLRLAVERFMSGSMVPPAWSYRGVHDAFGTRVARMWARHLRHLRANPSKALRIMYQADSTPAPSHTSNALRIMYQADSTPAPSHTIYLDEVWAFSSDPAYAAFLQRHFAPPQELFDQFTRDAMESVLGPVPPIQDASDSGDAGSHLGP